jgi:4-aminobutyrate aminotransferase-like enzyme
MSSTWGGNILSSAVALETIRILIEEKLTENAARVGAYMERRFRGMMDRHPILGDSRQMGLVGGLEIVTDRASRTPNPKAAERIVRGCYQKGLLLIEPIGLGGNVIRVAPPLVITEEQAGMGIDIIDGVMTEVEAG